MAGINVSFNGTSIQTNNILISDIGHDQLPTKKIYQETLTRADGGKITGIQYTDKSISLEGIIVGTSITDLDSRIDALKNTLSGQDQNMDIDYNGSTRRYIATLVNIIISRKDMGVMSAAFSAEFTLDNPFGRDTSTTTLLSGATITTTPSIQTFTAIGGTYTAHPAFTVTLNSGTGLTSKTITLTNTSTGQFTSVTRTWTAGDILIVDSSAITVTVNGTAVDYLGVFPDYAVGSTQVTYSDSFTTRNVTLAGTYVRRFL